MKGEKPDISKNATRKENSCRLDIRKSLDGLGELKPGKTPQQDGNNVSQSNHSGENPSNTSATDKSDK